MKKLFLIAILCCNFLNAQNVFPTTGNVGIGTVSPTQKLTVSGGNIGLDNQSAVVAKNSLGNYEVALFGRWTDNATYLDGGAGGTYFRTANGSMLNQYLSTNGNTGIGTTAPSAKLSVYAGAISSPAVNTELDLANFGGQIGNYTRLGVSLFKTGTTNNWNNAALLLGYDVDVTKRAGGFISMLNGNVGVGVVAPASKFHVQGSGAAQEIAIFGSATDARYVTFGNGASNTGGYIQSQTAAGLFNFGLHGIANQLVLKNNSNIGIGTANPTQKLTVSGGNIGLDNQGSLMAKNTLGTYENVLHGRWVDNATYLDGGTGGTYLRTGNSTVLNQYLSTNGNTGIGTTAPSAKLSVYAGAISSPAVNTELDLANFGGHVGNYTRLGVSLFKTGTTNNWNNAALLLGYDVDVTKRAGGFISMLNGNVGIGTVNPGYKLDVIGSIRAREVRVNLEGADFVFEDGYKLMPLNELEKFVKQNKHLPEIAPAKEMQEKGSDLGGLSVQLLQKIEELTLHMIEQNKEINSLKEQNKEMTLLKEKIRKLEQNKK